MSVPTAPLGRPDEALVDALKAWRSSTARERGVPAFVILHDRTLELVATQAPRSLAELATVPGIGPAKLADHGAALLSVIASVGAR